MGNAPVQSLSLGRTAKGRRVSSVRVERPGEQGPGEDGDWCHNLLDRAGSHGDPRAVHGPLARTGRIDR